MISLNNLPASYSDDSEKHKLISLWQLGLIQCCFNLEGNFSINAMSLRPLLNFSVNNGLVFGSVALSISLLSRAQPSRHAARQSIGRSVAMLDFLAVNLLDSRQQVRQRHAAHVSAVAGRCSFGGSFRDAIAQKRDLFAHVAVDGAFDRFRADENRWRAHVRSQPAERRAAD